MAQIKDIVIDCEHPASLARFWASVLDGYHVAPYGEAELARLRALGIDDVEDDPSVLVEAPGVLPRCFFQRVEELKSVKNRLHLDVVAEDPGLELARLIELGAIVIADRRSPGHLVTLADPEGNEFCLLWRSRLVER